LPHRVSEHNTTREHRDQYHQPHDTHHVVLLTMWLCGRSGAHTPSALRRKMHASPGTLTAVQVACVSVRHRHLFSQQEDRPVGVCIACTPFHYSVERVGICVLLRSTGRSVGIHSGPLWGVALWRCSAKNVEQKRGKSQTESTDRQRETNFATDFFFLPPLLLLADAAAACRFISPPLPPRSTIESSGRMPCPNSLQLERLSV